MKKLFSRISIFFKRTDYRHYICIGMTIGFLLINVFCFRYSFPRLFESLRDLVYSLGYAFADIFELAINISPTVRDLSTMPFTVSDKIPATWERFASGWGEFWFAFGNLDNFKYFWIMRRSSIAMSSKLVLLSVLALSMIIIVILLLRGKKNQNNDYNEDTKALRFFKRISDKSYRPVKQWLKDFVCFVGSHSKYYITWILIWSQSFNFFSILCEFFAFYFYFAVTVNPAEIFVQLYKLILDLSPMYKFVPVPVWFVVGIWIFDKIRKHRGYKVLEHHEAMNCGFINERGVFSLFVAPMRGGKNKLEVAFTLSREAMFRDMAYDIILRSDLKFPFFPWINLEKAMQAAMKKGFVYNLATTRKFIDFLHERFLDPRIMSSPAVTKSYCRKFMKKLWNYRYHNFVFDYDLDRYPVVYDNAKYIENLFDVIKDYAQAYFIYVVRSSLILSNYAIRTDGTMNDVGNLPLWDTDFFHVDSYDVDVISRHSHILNYDVLRLGRKVAEESAFAFEFGIIDITEIGKERLNMLESQGLKKDDDVTNQKNDGFDNWLKMCGHNATVDFTCFVSVYADDQREDQLPASVRQVGEIIRIEDNEKGKLAMPWYFLEDTLYAFFHSRFERLHRSERFNRGDNTLPYYIAHSIMAWIEAKHARIYNTFGYELIKVSIQDGLKANEKTLHKFFISNKKDLSKRYSTDCLSDTLAVRALRASWGLDDTPSYKTERASFNETLQQNSYFIRDITEQLKAPTSDVAVDPADEEEKKIIFLYIEGDDVEYCRGNSVSDLYAFFSTAVGAIDDDDFSAAILRLQKYTAKTDPYQNIFEWLSGQYLKEKISYEDFVSFSIKVCDLKETLSRTIGVTPS